MNLKNILKELNVEAKFVGNSEFDTLGVLNEKHIIEFCTFIDDIKFVNSYNDNVAVILVAKELESAIKFNNKVIVDNPRGVFFKVHEYLINNGIDGYARNKGKTKIGENCCFGKYVDIAENNVIIGNNVNIESFVSIRENSIIEDNVVIRSGTIIGGEGFEVKAYDTDTFVVIHGGGVIIKEGVEIQHNATIDKALYPWDNTIIGEDTKVDNLVHIAHGVKVGKKCIITAKCTIGGRTVIKDNCYLGLSATLRQALVIGENANISMGAVVTQNVPENGHVTGNLAIAHDKLIAHIKSIR